MNMRYAVQLTNGNAHIMEMVGGVFHTIAFTAGEDNLEACKVMVQLANEGNQAWVEDVKP